MEPTLRHNTGGPSPLRQVRSGTYAGCSLLPSLDPAYRLGTRFTVQFVVTPGLIRVTYNGIKTASLERDGSDYYFKAGCYTQANEDNSDEDSYGEVVIHALTVQHS